MKKIKYFLSLSLLSFFIGVQKAGAVCPVCAVVVSGGVGFSRWLGVDDSITGLWIGGLTVSMIAWTLDYMKKKKKDFRFKVPVVAIFYYAIIFVSLYYTNLMSNPVRTICSCVTDRLFIGIMIGSSGLLCGAYWYEFLKERNGGHAHFPFQKVVMPVMPLIILSFAFYFITK